MMMITRDKNKMTQTDTKIQSTKTQINAMKKQVSCVKDIFMKGGTQKTEELEE